MCVHVRIGCGPFGSVLGCVGRVFLAVELESVLHLQNKRENRAKKTWADTVERLFLAEMGALVLLYFIFIFSCLPEGKTQNKIQRTTRKT